MEPVRIASLELENVKRVQCLTLTPSPTGLTVLGGGNAQGKTSVLDAICFALGGEKYRPSQLQREGGAATARIELTLSNGLRVERRGKNAALTVTDPSGTKSGQRLLDTFIEELALNLPKFLAMPGREKAGVLLRILGIGDQLAALDKEEKAAYDERTTQGRIADGKAKFAAGLPEHHDVPESPLSAADLVAASAAVMERNATRAAARTRVDKLRADADEKGRVCARLAERCIELRQMLDRAEADLRSAETASGAANLAAAEAAAAPAEPDESTAEIEARLNDLEATNAKVRANLDKRKALDDAAAAAAERDRLTARVEDVRARRLALLAGAPMPLPGLSVTDGELTYNAQAWDCMSGAEQIRAGVAIVRKLRPECGFVLLDKLEALDVDALTDLGRWLEAEGLQAIATRVSKGAECTLIIEDGMAAKQSEQFFTGETEHEW